MAISDALQYGSGWYSVRLRILDEQYRCYKQFANSNQKAISSLICVASEGGP